MGVCCRVFFFWLGGLVGWVGGWVSCFPFFFFSFAVGWVVGVSCFFFFLLSRFWLRSLVGVVVAPVCRWWSGGCCRAVLLAALCGLLCCCAAWLLPCSLFSRVSSLFPVLVVSVVFVVAAVVAVVAVVACRFAAVAVAGVVGPLLLLLLAAAAFLLAMTFLPAPAKLRPHFRSACHRSPTYDNIVLTLPVSAPISAFGPSASSVLSRSGHGTALRTHHLPLVARRYGVFFFFLPLHSK